MKTAAIDDALTLTYDRSGGDVEDKSLLLRDILSAASLAYILDPENGDVYVDRAREALFELDDLHNSRGSYSDWKSHVPVANAVFHATLALDILYSELSVEDRTYIEQLVEQIVSTLNTDAWKLSVWAAKGSWALYRGDRADIDRYKELYRGEMDALLTDSGLFNGGTGYATSRFTKHAREQKFVFMDVLEHTDEDAWYDDPRLQTLYEWMFAHVYAPHAAIYIFGDAKLGTSARRRLNQTPATFRAHRFSQQAGRHAAWHLGDALPPGRLTIYVLADRTVEPERPNVSTIYPDGGAWFVHNPDDASFMAAALWNPRSASGHSHKEVNALNFAAFGEFLLVNVGYSNWGNGEKGFSWSYINDWAVSSNTVLVNHTDHASKVGGGIEEGFVGDHLSYASGRSGPALANGRHSRSLVFVPPGDQAEGYWVLFDEMEDAPADAPFSIALHPYSSDNPTVSEAREYEWNIHQRWAEEPVRLSIFLSTPPEFAQITDGVQADKERSIRTRYLYSTYRADGEGRGQAATILVPHNALHPKPEILRFAASNTVASRISFSEALYDVVAESPGDVDAEVDGARFRGRAALFRMRDGRLESLFARRATTFTRDGVGFRSEQPSTVFLRGQEGTFITSSGEITFLHEGLEAILVNGERTTPVADGAGWATIFVDPGTHHFTLQLAEGTALEDAGDQHADFAVRAIYPQPAQQRATLVVDLPETARLQVDVFDVMGRLVFQHRPVQVYAGFRSSIVLDDLELPSGTYLYRVTAYGTGGTWQKAGKLSIVR